MDAFQYRNTHMSKRKLTEEESGELRKVFDAADVDGDGKITHTEVAALLKQLSGRAPTMEEIAGVINQLDADKDGVITFAEFETVMSRALGRVCSARGAVAR